MFLFFKIFVFLFFCFSLVAPTYAHDHHDHHDSDIEMALIFFEKAYLLSPDLLPNNSSLTPYYQYNKREKLPLNQSFIALMRGWIHIFADEMEKNCEDCNIDREKILQEIINQKLEEARNSIPKNQLVQTSKNKVTHGTQQTMHYTAKHGMMVAGLIGIIEAFETVASFALGLKGIHLLCTPIQLLIIPSGRAIQRYGRTLFDYGFNLNHSSLLLTSKMAWTTRQLNRRSKNTFFYINQALEFNQEELERINAEGPQSLFRPTGHRLLWLERLKKKTDPLFKEINRLEQELKQTSLTQRQKNKIENQIQSTQNKIAKLSKINRKEFFGNRFKRYLFLKSRKGRARYMDGQDLKFFNFMHKILGGRNFSWPLAPQFMIKQTLEDTQEAYKKDTLLGNSSTPNYQQTDDVISGLVDEFLTQSSKPNTTDHSREAVHFFISDFHNLFNTAQTHASRTMSAKALEVLLTQFFAHYLIMAEKKITNNSMNFRTKMKIYYKIGKIQRFALQFTDFLTAVAFATDPNKVNFYKYESIEKFFAFLQYFDQIGQIIQKKLSTEETLTRIEKAQKKVMSLSLTRDKNSQIHWIPFKKRRGKCYEITKRGL